MISKLTGLSKITNGVLHIRVHFNKTFRIDNQMFTGWFGAITNYGACHSTRRI